jgi:hypothetical protein
VRQAWQRRFRRGLITTSRVAARTFGALYAMANELPVAFHDVELERQCLDDYYSGKAYYREQPYRDRGLWPFEERAVTRFFPAPPARILVPGAGTGREMLALLARDYQVEGIEPTERMVELADRELLARGAPPLRRMTLQQWVRQPAGRYDAILTGWAMWTHILHHDDRVAALRAFRQVCPAGPLLLSFDRAEPYNDHAERHLEAQPLHPPPQGRVARITRTWLRRGLLRLPPLERGTGFRGGLYIHWVAESELAEEGGLAGYRVAYYERDGSRYPHAVLIPT